jgi:outer membrane protein assembly factor BamB
MRRLSRGRKAKRLDPFDVTAWVLFGGFVLLIFLVSVVWPNDWWPHDTDDSKDTTMADDTGEYEEDEPVSQEEGPTPKWSLALPHPLSHRPVLDGTVLVTTAWQGAVYGVDSRTGRKLWSLTTSDGINAQPVVSGGLAHIYEAGELRTIDTRTGKVKWKENRFFDDLAAADGSLVTTWGNEVAAVRQSDGEALWSVEMDDAAVGQPALNKDSVYVSVRNGELYAFDAGSGTVRWRKDVTREEGSRGPVLVGTTVIVDAGKQIVALDARNGKELWRKDQTLVTGSDMVTISGLLIFNASVKAGQTVTAVDLKDGTQRWGQSTGSAEPLSLSASADRLYITYDSERLCAYKIADGALKDCFAGINTLPGTAATADGVYATSYNQRIYYFQKGAFE